MSRSILLVDDDDDLATALIDGLSAAGYEVHRCAHGALAMERLGSGHRPDLVLLDLMMPVMTGWQLCEALAAEPTLCEIPVVVMTASGRGDDTPAHAREVVRKPFGWDTILGVIQRYIAPEG